MRPRPLQHSGLPTHRPLDALWQSRALAWVVLAGECLALVLTLAPGGRHSYWTYFALASLLIQWITLLSLGMLYVARERLRLRSPQVIARLALALLVANALLVSIAARAILGPSWIDEPGLSWGGLILRIGALATVVGLLGLAAFQNHWAARKAAVRAKQADLESLQARIRPHFLFNTLNTGAALVHRNPERAEQLLLDLADLFRAALAGPRDIPLEEELDLVRRYLDIEAMRFGERLRVEWELPAEIPRVRVPALSIQPLVENAIRHGVERIERGGRVEITLSETARHVLVRVRNALVLGDAPRPHSHGVGLSASQARIEALTGGVGSVETRTEGEHFVATVRLPKLSTAPRP
ncbi:sensor histidine kinase [Cognatilysobacter lacus]|uniref:Sensor histidine kinase n=1 Tax=Cognatilysobacter lacus TaxID=1643323 RepID=A0A5D8ZBB3_9GAMM|nr:histidine kinase [Lysobacter lacus]TZF91826.1 sensor histidine kinase [Lysobacter lacus]